MRTAYDRRPEDEVNAAEAAHETSSLALAPEEDKALHRIAYILAWSGVAIGLLLPWSVAVFRIGFGAFVEALLGPEHDVRLVGLFNGLPFIAFGVFAWAYLHFGAHYGRQVVKERLIAIAVAGALMVGASLWYSLVVTWPTPGGEVFLPVYLLIAFGAGLAAGRYLLDSDAEPE